jgi:hypothetical protein
MAGSHQQPDQGRGNSMLRESAGVSGAEAAEQVRRDEAVVTERVAAARTRGRSWNRIAVPFGVSRQAACHRFAGKIGWPDSRSSDEATRNPPG